MHSFTSTTTAWLLENRPGTRWLVALATGAVVGLACNGSTSSSSGTQTQMLRSLQPSELVGVLRYGETSPPVAYHAPPRYRGFAFAGREGDVVRAWVRSADGDAEGFLLGPNFGTLATNDDVSPATRDAYLEATLTVTGTHYIAFRDVDLADATFLVTLDGTGPLADAGSLGDAGPFDASGLPVDAGTGSCSPASETIDALGDLGLFQSLAVHQSGTLYAAYYDATNRNLKFAEKRPGGSWRPETVDAIGDDRGRSASLAVDSAGNVHIAYADSTSRALRYAYRPAGGGWELHTVNTWPAVGAIVALALDNRGSVHVVETVRQRIGDGGIFGGSFEENILSYGRRDNASAPWRFERVTPLRYSTDTAPALAVDDAGGIHAAIHEWGGNTANSGVQYMYHPPDASRGWVKEPVTLGQGGGGVSMAVDPTGTVHMATYDGELADLTYRRRDVRGAWTEEPVDWVGNVGASPSLARDALGGLHVTYYDRTNGALKYARKPVGGAWALSVVDAGPYAGTVSSMALDSQGIAHVSYRDERQKILKYARLCR